MQFLPHHDKNHQQLPMIYASLLLLFYFLDQPMYTYSINLKLSGYRSPSGTRLAPGKLGKQGWPVEEAFSCTNVFTLLLKRELNGFVKWVDDNDRSNCGEVSVHMRVAVWLRQV